MPTVVLPLVTQALLPLALILWVAVARRRSNTALFLDLLLAASTIVFAGVAGLWLALPWQIPGVLTALLAVAAFSAIHRVRFAPTDADVPNRSVWPGILARVLVLVPVLTLTGHALAGRQPIEGPALDLDLPVYGGTWIVADGGSNRMVNAHLRLSVGEASADLRGQSYAVDIVRVGGWGTRKAGLAWNDPSAYAAFGEPALAPCAGMIVNVRDGAPDMSPPDADIESLAGNHVVIACDDAWIFMAHLQCGSIVPRIGESVRSGSVIARVGNSGASNEPRLHIHAQSPGTRAAPMSGDPLPITFEGRQLVRNERIPPRPKLRRQARAGRRLAEAGPSSGPGGHQKDSASVADSGRWACRAHRKPYDAHPTGQPSPF